jgi:hypothetical protein
MSADPVGCLAVLVFEGRILRREWAPTYEAAGEITRRWAVELMPTDGGALRVEGARASMSNEELLRQMRRGGSPLVRLLATPAQRRGRPGGGTRRWRE